MEKRETDCRIRRRKLRVGFYNLLTYFVIRTDGEKVNFENLISMLMVCRKKINKKSIYLKLFMETRKGETWRKELRMMKSEVIIVSALNPRCMIRPSFLYLIPPSFYIHYSSFIIFSLSDFALFWVIEFWSFIFCVTDSILLVQVLRMQENQTLVLRWQLK